MIRYFLIIIAFINTVSGRYYGFIDPAESYDRGECVRIERTERWTGGLPEGEECNHSGERCALGLVCSGSSIADVYHCTPAMNIEGRQEEDPDHPKRRVSLHTFVSTRISMHNGRGYKGRILRKSNIIEF